MVNTPNQRQLRSTTSSSNTCTTTNASNIREAAKDELKAFRNELREELKKELSTTLITTLREELKFLKQQVADNRREIDELKEALVEIRSSNNYPAPEVFFNEMSQRLSKREYLILSGVPETPGSLEEAKKSDIKLVCEISQALGCDDLLPEEVSRLGKILAGRPRLLRFRCKSNSSRSKLLSKANALRSIQRFKHVFINPDLTRVQRDLQKTLRTELKSWRECQDIERRNCLKRSSSYFRCRIFDEVF